MTDPFAKHPRPWRVGEVFDMSTIRDANGNFIATVWNDDGGDLARAIVAAVNAAKETP